MNYCHEILSKYKIKNSIEQKYITLILLKKKEVTFQVSGHFWLQTTQVWLPNQQYQRVK